METAYRQVEWHWKEFRGRGKFEEMTGYRDAPYKRYPITKVPPYSVELELRTRKDGALYVCTGPFSHTPTEAMRATNTANMLVEQLGAFEVLDENLTGWIAVTIEHLNWDLLPPGENP